MTTAAEDQRCPLCGAEEVDVFLDIHQVPVHCNVLCQSYNEAVQVKRGEISLGFCRACEHIFNLSFDPELMEYDQEYENSLHFSPRFHEYAQALAERLINRYELHDKDVIEIGCGKGDFLQLLCQLGNNRGVGFDPSYAHVRNNSAAEEQLTFIQDFYSEKYRSYKADIICCRHVLEHIQHPVIFLKKIRNAIARQSDAAIFFEVPNAGFNLSENGIWDIIYEHCSYFSPVSLNHAFSAAGFNVQSITKSFGDQFLCIEAMHDNDKKHNQNNTIETPLESISAAVTKFAGLTRNKITQWKQNLHRHTDSDDRVVLWGGGSKGVTFLNTMQADQIKYVVDINPHKRGKYVPGTGQEIVLPEFLSEYRPDVIIVMNPMYVDEIKTILNNLTSACPEMALSPKLCVMLKK